MNYIDKIEENFDQQVKTLQELISIKSVAEDPVMTKDGENYPFGSGVQDAFAYALDKGKELGFEAVNIDNYGGHIDFGNGPEVVGILGHLDVVPEGDGWSFDPYSGAIVDDYIYGRGTTDDKGPVVAALFAMKALKDAGYAPKKTVRLILGLDEETGWKGMYYYLDRVKAPDYGFTPDADFPALNGEKGILTFEIAKKFAKNQLKGLELRSLKGGKAANMVADTARAVVRAENMDVYSSIKDMAAEARKETGHKINIKGVGKSLEITTEGIAAHGATPEAGLNAISIMMNFLGKLNFVNDDVNDFVGFYNDYIGFDLNGDAIGCGLEDEMSGKLTFNVGEVEYTKEAITLTINVRYPVTATDDQVYDGILPLINKYNLGIIKLKHQKPIYMDPESPMIRALMEVYQENTGDKETKPLVIGGGTYARACDNIVAFGAAFPGDPDLMHQKDEKLSLEKFKLMTKIYADAIYKLTQEDFTIDEQ